MLRRDKHTERIDDLETRLTAAEQQLDHERLYPLEWANRRVRDRVGNAVSAGPFAGLRYPDWGITGINLYAPKVLGIYEREVYPALEEAIAGSPPVAIVIGSAEGYFAVGLARRLPAARVVAYDANQMRVTHLREIAALNEVVVEANDRECTHADLEGTLRPGSLIVCDCDGCEDFLLDPQAAPVLRHCTIIVEAHDLWREGITDNLRAAFEATHDIEQLDAQPRYVDQHPELAEDIPLVTRQLAISEFRGAPMWWLVLRPRAAR